MTLLLVALLLAAPQALPAETVHVALSVEASTQGNVPDEVALGAGLARAWAEAYGRFADIVIGAGSDPRGADPFASAILGTRDGRLLVTTSLTRAGATRSLESTVPPGALASLVATMSGDIAFLLFAARGFGSLALAPPPALTASLRTDDLRALTRWHLEDLEPLSIAAIGDQVTVCFPHAYLTLGPSFAITADTVRDLDAQSGGSEKLQLSGIAAAPGGTFFLLSESTRSIVQVRPRPGSRAVFEAVGGNALAARAVDSTHLATVSNSNGAAGITIYSTTSASTKTVPVAASYVSAFARDREGNFWAWDATERRIRILTPGGVEVGAIRPLFSAAVMQLPEQLEVYADGSFLLGGSGEVWKFERTGIPDWRLTRIPGPPSERLPSSFSLALSGDDGSFTLLDAPSRRLLAFLPDPAEDRGGPAPPLTRMGRGTDAERTQARIETLRAKAVLYAGFADSLARDLIFDRAETAYLGAGEAIRELAAESPDDPDAPALLSAVVARRQEVRAALTRASDVRVEAAALAWQGATPCAGAIVLRMRIRNTASRPLDRIRIHGALPGGSDAPSMISQDSLAPNELRDVEIPLGYEATEEIPDTPVVSILCTYEVGSESVSAAATLRAPFLPAVEPSPAESLACAFAPNDPLISGLPALLTTTDGPAGPLSVFAATLDALAAARRIGPKSGAADASARAVLRSLAPDEPGWALVLAGVATTLGMKAGFLSWPGHVAALIDTGTRLDDAFSALPGLSRYRSVLSALSRAGMLCLPVSGGTPPQGASGGVWAFGDALELTRGINPAEMSVAWADPSGPGLRKTPLPVPFPFSPPSPPALASDAGLRDTARQIMEQETMTVCILYGGKSGEHEVSLRSAASVVKNLDPSRYHVIAIGIDKGGRWHLQKYLHTVALPGQGDVLPVVASRRVVSIVPSQGVVVDGRRLEIDCVIPILHGTFGEDGTVQGLLEVADIPFVGAGVLGSAASMDKEAAKRLWRDAGLPIVEFSVVRRGMADAALLAEARRVGWPVFVKPCAAGSSLGAGRANDEAGFLAAVRDALRYDTRALVERCVSAREIECAVVGNDDPRAFPPGEIVPSAGHGFYSYEAKYTDPEGASLEATARLDPATRDRVMRTAEAAYAVVRCAGMARVDFFLEKETGTVFLNEINTIPGFTSISMFPRMCEAGGLPYGRLLDTLVDLARERHAERATVRFEK